jgi:nicotinate-nucleotide adenylyltransferase
MKTALFGGTFDPIHLGHTDMIRQLCDAYPLDRVIFMPAYLPPHKLAAHTASFEDRLAMVRLATRGSSNWTVSDYESTVSGPSYTYRTLCHFLEVVSADDLYYIMGQDSFNSIKTWYRWEELLGLCHFIIIDRHGYDDKENAIKDLAETRGWRLHFLPLQTLPISSSLIREKLEAKGDMDGLLDDKVLSYIKEHHLYEW